jgi:MYXO-CTERM domain-containing protein
MLPTFGVERAFAEACANDECGPGYVCESHTGTSCYSSCYADAGFDAGVGSARDAGVGSAPLPPLPTPGTSVDGGKPLPVDGGLDSCWANPICEPYEYHYCNAAPCTADSDCPSSMVCHADSWWECSSSGCKPGGDCDADAGESVDGGSSSCTEHSENRCTPRINLPCQADADCGEGYECAESRWYGCSGGGAVSTDADGGFVFADAGSVCQWYTSTYCKVLDVPCESDSECANGLRCQPHYEYSQCDADASVGADGGWPACEPVLTGNTCQYWYDDAGVGYDDAGVPPPSGGGTVGGGSVGGSTGGGAFQGGGGGPGGAIGGGTPAQDAGTSGSADAGASGEEDEGGQHGGGFLKRLLHHLFGQGGCSVPGNAAQGNLGWLSLLGLGLLARRRRN